MSALVLGIGNVLLKDEGVGIRAVEELERRYQLPDEVEVLDGGTSGIELLSYVADRDHLIIIDAIKSGKAPGTVVRVEGEDVPATFQLRITPHQLGLSDLLAAAELTDELPGTLVLFGVEPKSMEMVLGLTEEVQASLPKLLTVVVEELRKLGYAVEPRTTGISETPSFWEK